MTADEEILACESALVRAQLNSDVGALDRLLDEALLFTTIEAHSPLLTPLQRFPAGITFTGCPDHPSVRCIVHQTESAARIPSGSPP